MYVVIPWMKSTNTLMPQQCLGLCFWRLRSRSGVDARVGPKKRPKKKISGYQGTIANMQDDRGSWICMLLPDHSPLHFVRNKPGSTVCNNIWYQSNSAFNIWYTFINGAVAVLIMVLPHLTVAVDVCSILNTLPLQSLLILLTPTHSNITTEQAMLRTHNK